MTNSVTPSLRQRAIETAQAVLKNDPVYLDTETTGLGNTDEIIEISIVNDAGSVLFESLVKPTQAIPPGASAVHGIRDEDVVSARTWPLIWTEVRSALFGRMVVIYNADFDVRMLQQTHARYRLPWKDRFNTFDMLKLYSDYHGDWDAKRRAYKYISLSAAGEQCGITLPNSHRATADTFLTRALLHHLAGVEW